jgi:hypothetical protein
LGGVSGDTGFWGDGVVGVFWVFGVVGVVGVAGVFVSEGVLWHCRTTPKITAATMIKMMRLRMSTPMPDRGGSGGP